jgi:hypothetical protein
MSTRVAATVVSDASLNALQVSGESVASGDPHDQGGLLLGAMVLHHHASAEPMRRRFGKRRHLLSSEGTTSSKTSTAPICRL